jgi:hypothetical protein
MAQQIILRRGLSTEWSSVGSSLVLGAGEPGFETDTGRLKIGDGVNNWNNLSYVSPSTIGELSDVSNVAAEIDQVLTWNGESWAPSTPESSTNTTYILSVEGLEEPAEGVGIRLTDNEENVQQVNIVGNELITISNFDDTISIAGKVEDVTFTGTTSVNNLNMTGNISSSGSIGFDPTTSLFFRPPNGSIFGSFLSSVNGRITQVFNSFDAAGHIIVQSHENPNSLNFEWRRSRGNTDQPTSVQPGDQIGDYVFLAHDGTSYRVGVSISAIVDDTIGSSGFPTKLTFFTNSGTSFTSRAELSAQGVWKANQLQAFSENVDLEILNNGTGKVRLPADSTVGGVPIGSITLTGSVANQAALPVQPITAGVAYVVNDPTPKHLWVSDGTDWVDLGEFQGPTGEGVAQGGTAGQILAKIDGDNYNTEWVDPFSGDYEDLTNKPNIPASLLDLGILDGDAGQVLTTDGDGNFSFTTVESSSVGALNDLSDVVITEAEAGQVLKYNGSNWINDADQSVQLFSRQTVSGTTGSLANGATGPINIDGFKSYALLKIQTSHAAWVRIYTGEPARQADAARTEGEDPLPGSGVIAEVITTGAETVIISPGTIGFNDENPVTDSIAVRVTNKSGDPATITVTLTVIQLEA